MPFFGFSYTVKMIDTVSILSLCKGATTMNTGHSAGEQWYKETWESLFECEQAVCQHVAEV